MTVDPRDAIWNEVHDLIYRVNYAVELKTALLIRWVWLDSMTKIAVAISSGGAALAGLVFWKNSDYTFLWPMFTSASALLAIVSRQLSVAEKLQVHAASSGSLIALGIDIGSLIVRMKINSNFSVSTVQRAHYEREKSCFPKTIIGADTSPPIRSRHHPSGRRTPDMTTPRQRGVDVFSYGRG